MALVHLPRQLYLLAGPCCQFEGTNVSYDVWAEFCSWEIDGGLVSVSLIVLLKSLKYK